MTIAQDEELTKAMLRTDPPRSVRRQRFPLAIERDAEVSAELLSNVELLSSDGHALVGHTEHGEDVLRDAFASRSNGANAAEESSYIRRDLGLKNVTRIDGLRLREAPDLPDPRIGIAESDLSFGVLGRTEEVGLYPDGHFGQLIGDSSAMRAVFSRLSRIAGRGATLLLEGESGTGKELAAKAVHEASARSSGPFVVVDCGSIPRQLLEAELFGHERGAYTGANRARQGAFVHADGGTIFLDEVGELDLELQPRLLGVLERREVKPIGGSQPVPVNVRIIAATNRDLRREVNRGAFREDLYYRLAVACVRLPPLRERSADIGSLVRHFLKLHGVVSAPEEGMLQRLMRRSWPGNVRELRNAVEQIVAFGIEELSFDKPPDRPAAADVPFKVAKARLVEGFEREYLISVLAKHKGNITAAANAAELDRVHFLRLLDRHGLRKPR